MTKLNVKIGSPGSNTSKRVQRLDKFAKRRYVVSQTVEFKKKRIINQDKKRQLRNVIEDAEDLSYESNMSIFPTDCNPIANFNSKIESSIVYFDLETSGFSPKAEILQLCAMHRN